MNIIMILDDDHYHQEYYLIVIAIPDGYVIFPAISYVKYFECVNKSRWLFYFCAMQQGHTLRSEL